MVTQAIEIKKAFILPKESEVENRSEINFVKDYKPGHNAVVELTNGRFVDVMNGCFFDKNVSVLIKNGKIVDALFMDGRLIINNCGLEV